MPMAVDVHDHHLEGRPEFDRATDQHDGAPVVFLDRPREGPLAPLRQGALRVEIAVLVGALAEQVDDDQASVAEFELGVASMAA